MKTLTIIIMCATLAGCAIVRVEHNVTVDVRECDVKIEAKGIDQ